MVLAEQRKFKCLEFKPKKGGWMRNGAPVSRTAETLQGFEWEEVLIFAI
jgi:hypothetical protein